MYVNITEHFRKMIFPRTRFSNTFSPHALVCSVYLTYNSHVTPLPGVLQFRWGGSNAFL